MAEYIISWSEEVQGWKLFEKTPGGTTYGMTDTDVCKYPAEAFAKIPGTGGMHKPTIFMISVSR